MKPYDDPEDWSTYPAQMRPVSFPTGAANAAKSACDRIAALLHDHLSARPGLVADARDGWEGRHRQEFDTTWRGQETGLIGLKDDLRRLSGAITTTLDNVAAVNRRRASLRTTYLQEQSQAAND
jgi:hypothetical protein